MRCVFLGNLEHALMLHFSLHVSVLSHTHSLHIFCIFNNIDFVWFLVHDSLVWHLHASLSLSHTKHWHFSQFSLLITLFSLMSMCVHTFIVDICEKLYLNKFIENGALWFRLWLQNFLYIYFLPFTQLLLLYPHQAHSWEGGDDMKMLQNVRF